MAPKSTLLMLSKTDSWPGIKIILLIKELYLVGIVQVKEFLYTQVIIWVNISLHHIDTRVIMLRHEDYCKAYRPQGYGKKKKLVKHSNVNNIKKCDLLIIDTEMV